MARRTIRSKLLVTIVARDAIRALASLYAFSGHFRIFGEARFTIKATIISARCASTAIGAHTMHALPISYEVIFVITTGTEQGTILCALITWRASRAFATYAKTVLHMIAFVARLAIVRTIYNTVIAGLAMLTKALQTTPLNSVHEMEAFAA